MQGCSVVCVFGHLDKKEQYIKQKRQEQPKSSPEYIDPLVHWSPGPFPGPLASWSARGGCDLPNKKASRRLPWSLCHFLGALHWGNGVCSFP